MSDQQQLWKMIEDFEVCMATTHNGGTLRSRPMAPFVDKQAGVIRFLTEAKSAKVGEVEADHDINLAFATPKDMDFVSVSGTASISTDRRLIKELWNSYAEAWFEGGPESADVAVVTVTPSQAELWDGESSKLKTMWELAKAKASDRKPDLGENKKIVM